MHFTLVFRKDDIYICSYVLASMAQRSKRLPPMRETWVRSLGREDPLEKEMVTHSSILAWRIPWTEKPGRVQSMGLQSWTRLSDFTILYTISIYIVLLTISIKISNRKLCSYLTIPISRKVLISRELAVFLFTLPDKGRVSFGIKPRNW